MGITLDNSIIDFVAVSNIVNTLQAHEDVFTAFESEALVSVNDQRSTLASAGGQDLNITSVKIACVKVSATIGTATAFNYNGVTFTSEPTITATIQDPSTGSHFVAQIVTNGGLVNGATSYGGGQVIVYDTANKFSGVVTVNIIAIGAR